MILHPDISMLQLDYGTNEMGLSPFFFFFFQKNRIYKNRNLQFWFEFQQMSPLFADM